METTHANYYATVREMAKEALEREASGEDIADVIWEGCDGNYWVIYTHAAMDALRHSDNHNAGFESLGPEVLDGCESYEEIACRLAFHALNQDVLEAAESLREGAYDE